jgi:histone H3/H4
LSSLLMFTFHDKSFHWIHNINIHFVLSAMEGDETPRTILRGLRRALGGEPNDRTGRDGEDEEEEMERRRDIDQPAESDVLAGARQLAEELSGGRSSAHDGPAGTEDTPRTTLRRLAESGNGGMAAEKLGGVKEVSFLQSFEDRGARPSDVEDTPRTVLREFARVAGKRVREDADEHTLVIDRHALRTPKTPDFASPASFASPFASPMVSPGLVVGSPAPTPSISAPEMVASQDGDGQQPPPQQSGLRRMVGHGRRGRGSRGAGGLQTATIPTTLLKDMFRSHTSKRIASESFTALHEVVALFFDQVCDDLTAYASHANRKTIERSDFECLMRRQKILKGSTPLSDAIRRHLPIDQSELLLPKAKARE